MKIQHLISAFTGGELSRRLDSRVDIKKYASGCRVLENFTVVPHGGARKRSGTKFVIRQKTDTDDVVLIPYQYNTEQAYILVFGPSYIWFFKDGGIITDTAKNITGITKANPAVVTSNSHGFTNGDVVLLAGVGGMTEVNNRHFVVAGATTNTFQLTGLNSSSLTTYTSGGTASKIIELATNYTADQIGELQVTQGVNDVVYIAHKAHPLQKLTRSSHTSWSLVEPNITTGPFRGMNGNNDLGITPYVGSVAITGVTAANPAVVTCPGHAFTVGQRVLIRGVVASGGTPDPGYGGGADTGGGGERGDSGGLG